MTYEEINKKYPIGNYLLEPKALKTNSDKA